MWVPQCTYLLLLILSHPSHVLHPVLVLSSLSNSLSLLSPLSLEKVAHDRPLPSERGRPPPVRVRRGTGPVHRPSAAWRQPQPYPLGRPCPGGHAQEAAPQPPRRGTSAAAACSGGRAQEAVARPRAGLGVSAGGAAPAAVGCGSVAGLLQRGGEVRAPAPARMQSAA
jgi:hypothetical protein